MVLRKPRNSVEMLWLSCSEKTEGKSACPEKAPNFNYWHLMYSRRNKVQARKSDTRQHSTSSWSTNCSMMCCPEASETNPQTLFFLAATPQRFKSLPAVRPQVCPMHSMHALLLLALYGEAKEGKYTCPGECYGQNDEYMCTIKIKR